jgi:hypothetical protein
VQPYKKVKPNKKPSPKDRLVVYVSEPQDFWQSLGKSILPGRLSPTPSQNIAVTMVLRIF